jgi:hypothetical protein
VVETVFYEDYLCPSERTCAMVRCIPDLVFLTAYSLIILFWAQVSHDPQNCKRVDALRSFH